MEYYLANILEDMIERIFEYLWSRAKEKWNRAKKLVNFVVQNDWKLDDIQRAEIFDLFLIENWIKEWNNPDIELVFKTVEDNKSVTLIKLSDVKWVNKLLSWEELEFSKNITVIYWQNGSWKTWYSRILKSLWNSYDIDTSVLWDVFDTATPTSPYCKAIFKKEWDTNESCIEWMWDWKQSLPIGLFNSSCVDFWLELSRKFTFMPHWFHLFEITKEELMQLLIMLNKEINTVSQEISTTASIMDNLKWKEVKDFFDGIKNLTSKNDIDNFISKTTIELDKEKEVLEQQQKDLHKELISTKNLVIDNELSQLDILKTAIKKYEAVFSKDKWELYVNSCIILPTLETKPRSTILDIAKEKWIEFYESPEFSDFIKKADSYLTKLWKQEADVCPYCRQELSDNSKDLLISYQKALHNDTQKQIDTNKKIVEDFTKEVESLTEIELSQVYFRKDENWLSIIPSEISFIVWLKTSYAINSTNKDFLMGTNFKKAIEIIALAERNLNQDKQKNIESLKTIDQKSEDIKKQIDQLDDQILFISKKEDIKEYFDNIKLETKMKWICSHLHGVQLSWNIQKAKNDLISENFKDILKQEWDDLLCPDIDYKLKIDEWKTAINQSISNNKLKDILSEWEQKSIALAEFIAELKMSWGNKPIVFDDPVNSLDEERLTRVARKLMNLSKERQVIVFTHNLLLFYAFEQIHEQYNKQKLDFEYVFYSVERQNWKCWKLLKNIPPSKESFKAYITKINKLLNPIPKDIIESELSTKCYEYLRSAIELLVEEGLFNRVVKRYKKNVATSNLLNISWNLIDIHKEKILEIFERCCWFIDWHSTVEEAVLEPTLNEFQKDFEEIQKIWKNFNP